MADQVTHGVVLAALFEPQCGMACDAMNKRLQIAGLDLFDRLG